MAIWTVDPAPRLRVFRVGDGSLIGSLATADEPNPYMVFSEDGSRVAFRHLNDLWLWSVSGRPAIRVAAAHTPSIISIAFAGDDSVLATAGGDRLIKLWDPRTCAPLATLAGHRASVRSVAFTADSRTLASVGEDGVVALWSVAAREELFDLARVTNNPVHCARLSPGDRRLAVVKEHGAVLIIPIGDAP
jgi:WD40 repeat protein